MDFRSKTSTTWAVNNKHATYFCQHSSSDSFYSITTTSSLSTKLGFKYIASYQHTTLIANPFHFSDKAQAATATNYSSTTA
jgi:hypothetical protein